MNQLAVTDIPQDIEAEQAVLGAIIYNNDILSETMALLSPNSFFLPAHQYIFRAMSQLAEQDSPIDEITLGDELKSLKQLDEAGGYPYLTELLDCVPSAGNVLQYSKIVQEHSLLRDLIETSSEIARKSRSPDKNITELLAEAETKIAEISLRSSNKSYTPLKDILVTNFQKLETTSETADEITGLATGFQDLDKLTSGLQPSDLIVVAARPSMGKTAFALNLATYIATPNKHRAENQRPDEKGAILLFSLEMSKEQLVMRMLTSESKVDSQKLRAGNLDQDDWNKVAIATDRHSTAPIFINDSSNLTPYELTSISKQLDKEQEHGVSLIIVDYLQLMRVNRNNISREQEIAEISRSLKALAKDLNIPVIALSQLNRSLESRSNKHPQLSDLRESGAIEQDADIILFIYRDEVYNPETPDKGKAEIIIAKHRNGPIGMLRLAWIGKHTKFDNLDQTHQENF